MDELKLFEGVGGKGEIEKVRLPIVEKTAEEPVFICVDDTEKTEE